MSVVGLLVPVVLSVDTWLKTVHSIGTLVVDEVLTYCLFIADVARSVPVECRVSCPPH